MAEKSVLMTIREYFGMSMTEFRNEWSKLTDEDKAHFKSAFENESLTY